MRDYHMANSKTYANSFVLFAFLLFSPPHVLTHKLFKSFEGDIDLLPPYYSIGAADYKSSNVKDIGIHDNDFGLRPPLYADAVDYQPSDVKDIGIHDNDIGAPPPWYNGEVDYHSSNRNDISEHRHDEFQEVLPAGWSPSKIEPTNEEIFHNHFIEMQRPFSSIKSSRLEPKRDHHTNAIDYQLSGLKDTEAIPPEWLPPRSEPTHDEIFHNRFIDIQRRPFSSIKSSRLLESDRDHHIDAIDYQLLGLKCIEQKNYKDGTEMMSHRKMVRPHEENNDLRSFHASPVKI